MAFITANYETRHGNKCIQSRWFLNNFWITSIEQENPNSILCSLIFFAFVPSSAEDCDCVLVGTPVFFALGFCLVSRRRSSYVNFHSEARRWRFSPSFGKVFGFPASAYSGESSSCFPIFVLLLPLASWVLVLAGWASILAGWPWRGGGTPYCAPFVPYWSCCPVSLHKNKQFSCANKSRAGLGELTIWCLQATGFIYFILIFFVLVLFFLLFRLFLFFLFFFIYFFFFFYYFHCSLPSQVQDSASARKPFFSLSQPGGHPHLWNAVSSACSSQLISVFTAVVECNTAAAANNAKSAPSTSSIMRLSPIRFMFQEFPGSKARKVREFSS